MEAGVNASGRTIQRAMGTMGYRKCIAYLKSWTPPSTAKRRLAYAQKMLQKYPTPEHWKHVRFNDEVHFGRGPQSKLRIICKPGQQYCHDCIQYQDNPDKKDQKQFHCWAAMGYDFKSDIVFYNVPSNTNGKMSQQVYIDAILEPVVQSWLNAGQTFVLEEDRDSGHGTSKSNIVRTWKQEHGLKSYFNCASSPELAPIENCWQPLRAHMRKYPHWDDKTTRDLITKGWAGVSQHLLIDLYYLCLIDYRL